MKKYFYLILLLLVIINISAAAQFSKYIVRLKNKNFNTQTISNPSPYLSTRALQRRLRYNIAIDSLDLPITQRYLDSIKQSGNVTILNVSKWLNQIAIQTTDIVALAKINSFSFVLNTAPIAAFQSSKNKLINKQFDVVGNAPIQSFTAETNGTNNFYNYGLSYDQIHIHNGEFLHNRGFKGDGMQLAMLDAGFLNYLTMPTFDSIRNNNQILGTWDFVDGNNSVNEDYNHGSNCLSTIAANMPGTFVGTAPKTSFYLFRTEDVASEYPIEEQNWAAGAEKADSLGVDICSTSLGYNEFDNPIFNHTYSDMNGNTTIISKAADIAAQKGMLIVNSAGNSGTSSWHYITAPADADSIMAVGAVNTSGVVGSFSSYGPSSDGQIKPSVASVGVNTVVANTTNGQPTYGSGTSFSCPNIAGLTTCLWQAFPEVNNMSIINAIQQSATKSNNPDDRVGYGIPDMKKAFVILIKQLYTKQFSQTNCNANLQWNVKTDSVISIDIERKLATENNYSLITTKYSTGAFVAKNFMFNDNLININNGVVKYRLKMSIATDTSFYLDSTTINFLPKPNLGADKIFNNCKSNSINLTTLYNTTNLSSLWTIANNTVLNPQDVNVSGNYQLLATNNSGCTDTANVVANFINNPNLGADKTIFKCTDSSINLLNIFNTSGLTYNWTNLGTIVQNPLLVINAGVYQVIVQNTAGCLDTAIVTLNNDVKLCPHISINPNPVIDNLNVEIVKYTMGNVEITIHNAIGQNVYQLSASQNIGVNQYSISMKNLAAGIYFITLKINNNIEAVKRILKR